MKRKSMVGRIELKMIDDIEKDNLQSFISGYNSNFSDKLLCNKDGLTFLGQSVKSNSLSIADYIIKCDPEEMYRIDEKGNLPLYNIKPTDDANNMIEIFKKHGFEMSKVNGRKGNMLHIIAPSCSKELYDKVLSYGVSEDEENSLKEKPKDVASRWGNTEISPKMSLSGDDDQLSMSF